MMRDRRDRRDRRYPRGRRLGALLSALAFAAALSACGIPPDPTPHAVRTDEVPAVLRAPRTGWRVYLSREAKLVGVDRSIPLSDDLTSTLASALAALIEPVTKSESNEGYENPLAGEKVQLTSVTGRTATIDVLDSQVEDDPTRLAQIVFTLTEGSRVDKVMFVRHALELGVLRDASGSEFPLPATRDNFETLVRRQTAAVLYFVRASKLIPVERVIVASSPEDGTDSEAAAFLQPLATDGPTQQQRREGITSYVSDLAPTLKCLKVDSTRPCQGYSLDLGEPFLRLAHDKQALAIGQILYTVEGWSRGSVTGVQLLVYGRPLDRVPTPGGRSVTGTVDKSLYQSLLSVK
jgi:hypothetical protein